MNSARQFSLEFSRIASSDVGSCSDAVKNMMTGSQAMRLSQLIKIEA
jgi:hypothetical protein